MSTRDLDLQPALSTLTSTSTYTFDLTLDL